MGKRALVAGLALAVTLTGCSATSPSLDPINTSHRPSASPDPITSAQIVTIDDGMQWAAALTDAATAPELRTGAQKIGDLVPRDKIWFETGNTIGQDIIKLNLATFNDSSHSAENVVEMKRIAIEIQQAIDHGDKP